MKEQHENPEFSHHWDVVIPEEVEGQAEDPVAWWVNNCIGILHEREPVEKYSMVDAAAVVLLMADIENEKRKSGLSPGKVSPIDWGKRLQNLVEGN